MRKAVRMSRAGRRVFAQKAKPSTNSLRQQFNLRGGGYL